MKKRTLKPMFVLMTFVLTTLTCGPLSLGGKEQSQSPAIAPPVPSTAAAPSPQFMPTLPAVAGEPDKQLTLGLHVGLGFLVEYDYATATLTDQVDTQERWKQQLERNLDWIVSAGYDTILLDVIDTEGYLFTSDLLAGQGYQAFPDLLADFMPAAHARGLAIFADMTVLAWRLDPGNQAQYHIKGNPLSVDQVQEVVATLLDDYDVDGIIEETYTSKYIAGIHEVCQARGRRYIHKWDDPVNAYDILMSEDYVGYLDSAADYRRLDKIGAAANNLGMMNVLFTHARALGIPAWVKVYGGWGFSPGASRNVSLLRAVQFQSDGYFWMDFGEDPNTTWIRAMDTGKLRQWLNYLRTPPTLAKRSGRRVPKPVANIFVYFPEADTSSQDLVDSISMSLDHTFGPLSNGLMLAGYDVRTTYNHALPDADLTVIMVPGGRANEEVDLSDEALQVLRGDKPAIVVPGVALAAHGRWREALPLLGISPDWNPVYLDGVMPETVRFAGQTIRWKGFGIWDYPPITSRIRLVDVTGEVLLSDRVLGQEVALIVRQGNKVFINGNLLHLDTSFIFNHLAALGEPTMATPSFSYGVVGTRSAFMAMGNTLLRINLRNDAGWPVVEGTPLRVIRFDADGQFVSNDQMTYIAPFQVNLARHELIIVEVAGSSQ